MTNLDTYDKAVKLYHAIADYRVEHGYPPSLRDLMPTLDTDTTSVVRYYLDMLKAWGCVTWEDDAARTIQLLRPPTAKIANARCCDVSGCTELVWHGPRGMNMRLTKCEAHQREAWRNQKARQRGQDVPAKPRQTPPMPKKTPHTQSWGGKRKRKETPVPGSPEALHAELQAMKDEVRRLWNQPHTLYAKTSLVGLFRFIKSDEEAQT